MLIVLAVMILSGPAGSAALGIATQTFKLLIPSNPRSLPRASRSTISTLGSTRAPRGNSPALGQALPYLPSRLAPRSVVPSGPPHILTLIHAPPSRA